MFFYVAILLALVGYYVVKFYLKVREYPPGPMPLPLIGNLLQLDFKKPHVTIDKWGKIYGPVFTLWLPIPHVIINDFETMRETFIKKGDLFSGRPRTWLVDFANKGNYGIVFAIGQMWKEQRRFALHVLRDLGFGKKGMERKILDQSEDVIVEDFTAKSGQLIDPQLTIQACVLNIISELLFGYSYKVDNPEFLRLKKQNDLIFESLSDPRLLLLESAPWLQHIPYIMGVEKARALVDLMIDFFREEVDKQKAQFDEDQEPSNYTQAYLKEMADRKRSGTNDADDSFTDWQLLMALADLWTAGMETTVTTLRWALLYMMNEPEIQDRVRAEINEVLEGREVSMEDKNKLPYVQAVLAEVQRCANLLPLNLQHTVTEDVTVNNFLIRKDTIVVPQIASAHMDERTFPNQERFDPERHLTSEGSFKKLDELVPFSMGKRVCLGESLARMELLLIFVGMLQKFKFLQSGDRVDVRDAKVSFIRAPPDYECVVEAMG